MVAQNILKDADIRADICPDLSQLVQELASGADLGLVTEEALRGDTRALMSWVSTQPAWSDLPFVVLTEHGGGLERNPSAVRLMQALGNVTFLERPFHATTLISVAQTNLRGRRRQYEWRRLNEELESRVQERTGELAAANRVLLAQIEEREKVEITLRQMQRLEAVGQLTSGVAHDFNNLLTVVLGNVEVLESAMERAGVDAKLTKRLGYMRNAAERGARLTSQLLAFSRRQRLEPKACDLNEVVSNMQDLLQSTIGGSIRIDTRLEPSLSSAMVDPTQLELAVLNLAINARDAMGVGGTLSVATANVTLRAPARPEEPPAGHYVSICVSDTGSGMSEEVRQKVFEPFFTTKDIGKGSGLGLSQVLGFAQQSGGGVRISSRLGRGTSVFIYLPQTQAHPRTTRRSARVGAASDAAGREHILLVDDDAGVREVTATILRGLGYTVYEAGSGGAALESLQSHPQIDLVLIDFAMPGMSGADVVRRLRATHPRLPTVFITGFADRTALADVSETHIIGKPFHPDELAGKVRAALSSVEMGHSAQ